MEDMSAFRHELEGFAEWLRTVPGRGGRLRSEGTVKLYRHIAEEYAKWAESRGYKGFGDIPPDKTVEFILSYRAKRMTWVRGG